MSRHALAVAVVATLMAMAVPLRAQQSADSVLPADADARRQAMDRIIAHPESVDPFRYAELIQALWAEGRRTQASFWFYVFQQRTRPWAEADRAGSGHAALRGALNATLGQAINGWVAGDVAAWRRIVGRAISYEARVPLSPLRPEGVAEAAWIERVTRSRAAYADEARRMLGGIDPEQFAAERRRNGLPVGPLPDAGPPLPDDWR